MSAEGKREELEAAAWRSSGPYPDVGLIAAILAAADDYATAVADERIAGRVSAKTQGRERLDEAAGEITRKGKS